LPAEISLETFVRAFADAFARIDARSPVWVSRSGRAYQPGLGPHGENEVVRLVLAELTGAPPHVTVAAGQALPYPNGSRQKCDLWLGAPLKWAIEVKMARFRGDNGKPDDTALKDLISPYEDDHSALTDCVKLARSDFPCRTALLVYGFDFDDRPLDPAIDALETLARARVKLGQRIEVRLGPLVHPVMSAGRVFAWEIGKERAARDTA